MHKADCHRKTKCFFYGCLQPMVFFVALGATQCLCLVFVVEPCLACGFTDQKMTFIIYSGYFLFIVVCVCGVVGFFLFVCCEFCLFLTGDLM